MKIPFDIKFRPQIESGKYKVETESGAPAKIFDWEWNNGHTGVCLAVKITKEGKDIGYLYTKYGKRAAIFPHEKDSDLFIVTPEKELTEFEKAIKRAFICAGWDSVSNGIIKDTASELLELTRKELIEEQYTSDPRKTDLYKLGKAEALKDLPRWNESRGVYRDGWINDGFLYYKNRSIQLSSLEKLPGFKEDEK